MQKSMKIISGVMMDTLDVNPTITPVLDLSLVQMQSRQLAAMTNVTPTVSYNQASLISAQQQAVQAVDLEAPIAGTSVKFEQNNYSPEALSAIEIYRQTRNQLALLKSALALT
jgi:hypothetical protein